MGRSLISPARRKSAPKRFLTWFASCPLSRLRCHLPLQLRPGRISGRKIKMKTRSKKFHRRILVPLRSGPSSPANPVATKMSHHKDSAVCVARLYHLRSSPFSHLKNRSRLRPLAGMRPVRSQGIFCSQIRLSDYDCASAGPLRDSEPAMATAARKRSGGIQHAFRISVGACSTSVQNLCGIICGDCAGLAGLCGLAKQLGILE